jgi:hypothetical protein
MALKSIGLKTFRKATIWNGPLECKVVGFDLYEGSRKTREFSDEDPQSKHFKPQSKEKQVEPDRRKGIWNERKEPGNVSKGEKRFSNPKQDRKQKPSDHQGKPSSFQPVKDRKKDNKPARSGEAGDDQTILLRKEKFFNKKKKSSNEIESYQPQNRFERPERTYRRTDGKVNEGDPSGSKLKYSKPKRPRKSREDEED